MEEALMEMDHYNHTHVVPDTLSFARSYQLEALDRVIRENTIVYAHHLRKPSPYIVVFLVPKVVLVSQQATALRNHTDLKVGMYWGDMGVDFWDKATWENELGKHEVLVMTPAILLDCLRHSFIKLNMIKVLIMDECHHAAGKHPYVCIMIEFYHRQLRCVT
ncbi:unnamed protein product [Vicia faba]|uniref:Helicase ATP-binding domain-containing protein n=1 Tax=Vicia faba TaxID=3906 RepID=A0AAV1ACL6_VICFA|nr:unnamed protein product [Vicia faba]